MEAKERKTKMKIYNVLFESDYENEDVHSSISSYRNREDAVKSLNKAIADELSERNYDDDEVEELLVRDGDDYACINYFDGNWMFRVTIHETELW